MLKQMDFTEQQTVIIMLCIKKKIQQEKMIKILQEKKLNNQEILRKAAELSQI